MCARMCAHTSVCADVCCHLPPLPCVFQMAIMFMKIDTNCDGTVDWDEFCTYMLLEYQEKDSMTRGGRMPYPHPLRTVTRQVLCRLGVRRGCGTGVRGMVHGVWHRSEGHGPWGVAQEEGHGPWGVAQEEGHGPWGVAQEEGHDW